MPDDDLLANTRIAKGYVDRSLSVLGYVIDHKRDEYLFQALDAARQAADDLEREVWIIEQNLLVSMGKIEYREVYDPEHTNIAEGIYANIPVVDKEKE